MNLEEAKRVILIDDQVSISRLMNATAVICRAENERDVKLSDLLACMRRGNAFGKSNAVDEMAALALYSRTGRKRHSSTPYRDFISDAADWEAYLKEHGLV
jgi:hypothetical protein